MTKVRSQLPDTSTAQARSHQLWAEHDEWCAKHAAKLPRPYARSALGTLESMYGRGRVSPRQVHERTVATLHARFGDDEARRILKASS